MAAAPSACAYRGNSEIDFFFNEQGELSVTIDTERLHIRSVEATEAEYDRYEALFGSPEVMQRFHTGEPKTREQMKTRIEDIWAKRWRERDPYAGLTIFKKDADDFLGHVVLGHSAPGEAELTYLFQRPHWGQGYGSEAVQAVVQEYAPATVEKEYLLEGKPLERIVATARADNPASARILEKVGMEFLREGEKHGAMRRHYAMRIKV